MVPCCMEVITCDEHSEILKQIEENGPMVGGAIGKHQTCPNDAAHAHKLASGKLFTKSLMAGRFYGSERVCVGRQRYSLFKSQITILKTFNILAWTACWWLPRVTIITL